ncbi:MAG: hypothetical protein LBR15_02390 [Methanobrevibacter sp.]|jgi:hypothetical protein|nr:hypothetical protein [Candidatus Methanovirga australis]
MNYKLIGLFIIAFLFLGSLSFINANDTGILIVEARTQDNDGNGYIEIYEKIDGVPKSYSHNDYNILKGETKIIPLPEKTAEIQFRVDGDVAYIVAVDKFLKAPVPHVIEVHVNFYRKGAYTNIFWIEGGWYKGSKNLYHPTWDSSVSYLEWNVAANHWNDYNKLLKHEW